MSKFYKVIEDYETHYSIPVNLVIGDKVKTGERFSGDPDWTGWIWCENQRGEKGWVLERVLDVSEDIATVIEDFCNRELDVKIGDILEFEKSEGGWLRCKNSDGESGWVPLKNVKQIG